MPQTSKNLIIGSLNSYSGKSTAVLGLAHCLQQRKVDIAYGKPLGNFTDDTTLPPSSLDPDVEFLDHTLNLGDDRLYPTLLMLNDETIEQSLITEQPQSYTDQLQASVANSTVPLVLLEGPGTLDEGHLYGLSLEQMAEATDAAIVLVVRFHSLQEIERLISAKQRLGNRLVG
ncbi:MAG: AAA family ATPase, partial [Prochlorothrix sp.]